VEQLEVVGHGQLDALHTSVFLLLDNMLFSNDKEVRLVSEQ